MTSYLKMDAPTKLEFDVEMTCGNCVKAVQQSLSGVQGITSFNVDLEKGRVMVESSLGSENVKSLIETSGRRAVLKGMGGVTSHLGAAVSILDAGQDTVKGLIRFVQTDDKKLVIDGTIDGLAPGKHALFMHELGDLSQGCDSCGDVFGADSSDEVKRRKVPLGDFGDIVASENGRAEFRFINERLKVWEMIGRSMVVHSCARDLARQNQCQNQRLSCGIVARSAGLFENTKKICACDGVTQWDERYKPAAGPGRQSKSSL